MSDWGFGDWGRKLAESSKAFQQIDILSELKNTVRDGPPPTPSSFSQQNQSSQSKQSSFFQKLSTPQLPSTTNTAADNEIASLRQRNKSLEETIQKLLAEMNSSPDQALQVSQLRVSEAENKLKELTQSYELRETQLKKNSRAMITQVTMENEKLRDERESDQALIQKLEQELEQASAVKQNADSDKAYEAKLADYRYMIENLQQALQKEKSQRRSSLTLQNELKDKISILEKELQLSKLHPDSSQPNALHSEQENLAVDSYKEKIDLLESQLRESRAKQTQLEAILAAKSKEEMKLAVDNSQQNGQVDVLKEKVEHLESQLQRANEAKVKLQTALEAKSNEDKEIAIANTQKTVQFTALTEKVENLESQLQQANEIRTQLDAVLVDKSNNEKEIEKLKNELNVSAPFKLQLDTALHEKESLQSEIALLKTQVQERDEMQILTEKKHFSTQDELVNKIQKLQLQLDKSAEQKDSLLKDNMQLQEMIHNLNQQSKSNASDHVLSEENRALSKQITDLKQKIEQENALANQNQDRVKEKFEAQLLSLTAEKERLVSENGRLIQVIENHSKEVQDTHASRLELSNRLEHLMRENKDLTDQNADLIKKLESFAESFQSERTEAEIDVGGFAVKELKDKVKSLTKKLEKALQNEEKLVEKCCALENHIQSVTDRDGNALQKDDEKQKLEEQVAALKEHISRLEKELHSQKDEENQVNDLIQEIQAVSTDFKAKEEKLMKENEELHRQLGSLETQTMTELSKASSDVEQYRKKISDLTKNLEVTRNALKKVGIEKNEVSKELKESKEKLTELAEKSKSFEGYAKEIQDITNKLVVEKKKCDLLQNQLLDKSTETDNLRAKLRETERSLIITSDRVAKAESALSFQEKELKDARDFAEKIKTARSPSEMKMKENLEQLQKEHRILIDAHKAAEIRAASIADELEQTLGLLSESTVAAQNFEASLTEERTMREDLERRCHGLQEELADFKDRAKTALEQREDTISKLRTEYADVDGQLRVYAKEIARLKLEREESKKSRENAKSNKSSEVEEKHSSEDYRELESLVASRTIEVHTLQVQVDKLKAELLSMEADVQSASEKAKAANLQAQEAEKNLRAATALSQAALENGEHETARLKAKIKSLQQELRRQAGRSVGTETSSARYEIEDGFPQLGQYDKELVTLRSELSILKKKLREAEQAKETIGDMFSF